MRKSNWRTKQRVAIRLRNRARGKASQRVQAAARMTREVDADTLRSRALHDARGQLLRHGTTYRSNQTIQWEIRRAVHGRVNQVEIVTEKGILEVCSLRTALSDSRLTANVV